MKALVWFRNNLRLHDNDALCAAAASGKAIIPVFILSHEEEGEWPMGEASRWWLHHSLKSLEADLKAIGLKLVLRTGNAYEVFDELIDNEKITDIYFHHRYEPAAREQESLVSETVASKVRLHGFHGELLIPPGRLLNGQQEPYKVFTPFWKKAQEHLETYSFRELPKAISAPKRGPRSESLEALQLLPKENWGADFSESFKPGESGAKELLQKLNAHVINDYPTGRDRPDKAGTSLLSPHLHFGEISPRAICRKIKQGTQNNTIESAGAIAWLRQLVWREFAYHLMWFHPRTPEQPLRKEFIRFPWRDKSQQLKKWQRGQTGYPMVDAGMRQLWSMGWMHNRVRMLVGSFLVKDLLIPWQRGAEWFWDTLLDADLANNTFGWQWVAGCGADASPYFRVFNPTLQAQKFDPDAAYIRRWVPELAKLKTPWIYKPWEAPEAVLKNAGIELGKTYPEPIVNHAEARVEALAAYYKMRNK